MSIRAVTVRLLAVVLTAALALTAAPAPAATPGEAKYSNSLFNQVNNKRENNDRRALNRHKCLQKFANRQAQRMANQRRMFHQDLGPILNKCGLNAAAENVAYSSGGPGSIVGAWMGSPGHRANILGNYRLTGVAARKGGGRWYAAQVFGRKG